MFWFGVLLIELDFCVFCAIFVQKNIKKGLVMPFVEFTSEFNTRISIDTDYIIAIGEKWADRSYITTTTSTIILNEDYQKVVNTIKHVTQQNKTR